MNQLVLVLDFGGPYKELIAGAIRELSVHSEIKPGNLSAGEISAISPIGIVLTGGTGGAPTCDPAILELGIPVLSICYGIGGAPRRVNRVNIKPKETGTSELFAGIKGPFGGLMSDEGAFAQLPAGFAATAHTKNGVAACEHTDKKLYTLRFLPDTGPDGPLSDILGNFLKICGAVGDYKLEDYIKTQVAQIKQTAGDKKVLLALSGGVDSSVCASLLSLAIPGQLICIFVDHGFMRLNEGDEIEEVFSGRDLHFIRINAAERFLVKIKDISDPETKRKLIGEEFVRVFEEEAAKFGDIPFLAQGTIYPDILESGGVHGATIKSHHNVGGLPDNLKFTKIIEPLAGLFKGEVRLLGKKLGLPASLMNRQPFPGPGLAIRVMGCVTADKLLILRQADAILRQELDALETPPSQYFAVLTNTLTVGIKGDERTYSPVIALRAVTTVDFMTCDYSPLPHPLLAKLAARITDEIPAVSRIVYDITSKPPATLEWE